MTITVGYWCDECRRKYVRHVCNGGLPCGHPIDDALFVECQHYAKARGGSDSFVIRTRSGVLLAAGAVFSKDENLVGQRWHFREWIAHDDFVDGVAEEPLAEWAKRQSDNVLRAFCDRWRSERYPPEWRDAQIRIIEVVPAS